MHKPTTAASQGRSKARADVAAMPSHLVVLKHIPSNAAVTMAAVMPVINLLSWFYAAWLYGSLPGLDPGVMLAACSSR